MPNPPISSQKYNSEGTSGSGSRRPGENGQVKAMWMRKGLVGAGIAVLAVLGVLAYSAVQEVGDRACDSNQRFKDYSPPPDEELLRTIDHSLEVLSGETVRMTLTLRNVTDEPLHLSLGFSPSHNFIVTTTSCEIVWIWAQKVLLPVRYETLQPGKERKFAGEWDRVDDQEEPVPPGVYLVHGVLHFAEPSSRLMTSALKLEVPQ